MPNCAVLTCKNNSHRTKGTDIKYFSFPHNEDLTKKWIQACCRQDNINLKHARICSIHFKADSFEIPMRQRLLQYNPKNSRNLKSNAVPALHLCASLPKAKSSEPSDRLNKTTQPELLKNLIPEIQEATSKETFLLDESNVEPMVCVNVDISQEIKEHETNKLGELSRKIEMLKRKNEELLQRVQKYENVLAEVFTPQQPMIAPTVPPKLTASRCQLTCGLPESQSFIQQLTRGVTACIKQEVTDEYIQDPQCFSEMREDSCGNLDVVLPKVECNDIQEFFASVNCDLQSSRSGEKEKGGVPRKLLISLIKPVKNEEEQHGSEPWSVFSSPGIITLPAEVKHEEE